MTREELIDLVKKIKKAEGTEEFKGKVLEGDYFLEVPTSNKGFFEGSKEYQKVLSDFNRANGVDIKIKYLDE